ncbi:hypothetical protein NQ318_017654 [Aromia moschata]|uniref:Uncharacterized protein n=1 Tax=Aromia moschata TaxID=1265417 RepID=A0AAV8XGB2_9CUCU|nr:hypothetical protein NQ318_017654 [Aromia moschata]
MIDDNTLHGFVNRQNCRYFSTENPHWMRELHTQNPEKVNVWAGIIGENIIGPFFIDGNLNGETYLALLQNNVVPTMANLYPTEGNPQLPGNAIWFQQDGASAYYEVNVRVKLESALGGTPIERQTRDFSTEPFGYNAEINSISVTGCPMGGGGKGVVL